MRIWIIRATLGGGFSMTEDYAVAIDDPSEAVAALRARQISGEIELIREATSTDVEDLNMAEGEITLVSRTP
jgi:hypothetical protein